MVASPWVVNDAEMGGRVLGWGGAVVAVLAFAGLGVYFAAVGLDAADKLASVIGLFIALVALGASGYGVLLTRRRTSAVPPRPTAKPAQMVKRQLNIARDNSIQYAVMDGTMNISSDGPAVAASNSRDED